MIYVFLHFWRGVIEQTFKLIMFPYLLGAIVVVW